MMQYNRLSKIDNTNFKYRLLPKNKLSDESTNGGGEHPGKDRDPGFLE